VSCVHVCLLNVWFVCVLYVPSVLWYCWLGLLTCKNRLPYDLYCVGGDVKHYSIQAIDGYHICCLHVHSRSLKWRTESINPSKHIYIATRVTSTAEALDSMDWFKCWLYALPNRVMSLAAFFKSFRKGFVVCRGLDANLSGKVAKKTTLTRKSGRHAHNVFLPLAIAAYEICHGVTEHG